MPVQEYQSSMNTPMTAGAVFILLGLLGFAIPFISTTQTKDVARIGDLSLQTTEDKSYPISPLISGGAIVVGAGLLGAGLYRKF